MKSNLEEKIESMLINILSDGFNRSIATLKNNGATDTTELLKEYKGAGSRYYDLVTRELETTAKLAAPHFAEKIQIEIGKDKA